MGWKGEINRSATFFVASNNWRSMWLKSPKWYLIACRILLPNFLVFPCEIEREFHVGSKFTQSIMLHRIYICILYISWKSLWQSFTSCGCDNFSFQVFSQIFLSWKFFLTYEFNKDSLFLLIHFYNFRQRKESKLKWFNPMRIYAFYCWLILFSRYGKRVKDIQDAMTHVLTR